MAALARGVAPTDIATMSDRKTQPPSQPIWDIYPAVEKAIRLGEVEAADEREAIEKAAKEFEQPAEKLIAVRRP
jgi:membrane-bound lytic murein transglycosylase B